MLKTVCSSVQPCTPEDGHNGARNILSYWFINKNIIVASSWSNKSFHIKDARSHEHQTSPTLQRMHVVILSQTSVIFANRHGVFFHKNLNSWYDFLLCDMNENYVRLWSAVSVTYCMCVEIRPFRCSYTRDLADVIIYVQCILRSKPKITWFYQKDHM